MGEKMHELASSLEQLVKSKGLSPAQAVVKAGLSLDNKSKLLELAQDAGIVDEAQAKDSTSLRQMAQQLVSELDPDTKQSLASFLSEVIADSNVDTPPAEVQQFLDGLLPKEKAD
ncbi:MAG: hypothetical protein ACOYEO_03000 [bacterium]|jgi:uncharacterized tellurite resistance protein B-like protein